MGTIGTGPRGLEVLNPHATRTYVYGTVVQVLPVQQPADFVIGGGQRNNYHIQLWSEAGTVHGTLGMVGVVKDRNGIIPGARGYVEVSGTPVRSRIDCSTGTRVSQFDCLVAVSGGSRWQKYTGAGLRLTGSEVVWSVSDRVSAGDLSGSVVNVTDNTTAIVSQINQNTNSLRLLVNQLISQSTNLNTGYEGLLGDVERQFDVAYRVRAIYLGSATTSAISNASGDVMLINARI